MSIELRVPSVGESITDVQIGEWLKSEGDRVRKDEVLVLIDTDKVTVELQAPAAGVLKQIKVKPGEEAQVGDVIGYLEEAPGVVAEPTAREATSPGIGRIPEAALVSREGDGAAPPWVMPAAERALAQAGLSAADIEATGPGGRLLKEDVERHAKSGAHRSDAAPRPRALPEAPRPAGTREDEIVRMTPLRRRIAERLVEAQQTAALLTTWNEIDMSEVLALRKTHGEAFQEKYGVKLGMMGFFVKAVVEALKLVPEVNAEIRDKDIVYHKYYDIGIAVGGGKGLVVPVIRDADRKSLADVERSIGDFGARAKSGELRLEELEGGTFTISNGGVYGSLMATPILNPPQSGILGLHAIQERAVVREGQVVVRSMMYVALTYDHRIIDGRESILFLKHIKHCVEQPARILLQV